MRVSFALAALVAASGCQSKPIDQMGYQERWELAGEIVLRCQALGLQLQTPQMNQCTAVEAQREAATRSANAAQRARFRNALADGMGAMGDAHYRNAQTFQNNRTTTNCRSVRAADGSIQTSCY